MKQLANHIRQEVTVALLFIIKKEEKIGHK